MSTEKLKNQVFKPAKKQKEFKEKTRFEIENRDTPERETCMQTKWNRGHF